MHQEVHDIRIDVENHYVVIRCDETVAMYDEIPNYCPYCGHAL